MACRLRKAGDDDWATWFGCPPPPHWFGLVAENERMLLGIGGAYVAVDGRWWAMMSRAPGVEMVMTMQKAARLTLSIAGEAGLELFARADPAISASGLWLARLGFTETEFSVGDLKVWRWARN